jgi:tetratricopeptide (TPR) repeat protein
VGYARYRKAQYLPDSACVQREARIHRVSLDTILFLETIVHFYSYTRYTALHPGRELIEVVRKRGRFNREGQGDLSGILGGHVANMEAGEAPPRASWATTYTLHTKPHNKMTDQLLAPPTHISPTESLRLSQLAPKWLRSQAPSSLPYPLSLFTTSESAEQWQANENLLIACLRTGDDETASICLDKLSQRFGPDNERVQALRGLYDEATAVDEKALLSVLKSYDETLKENPANVPVMKRKVALLRGLGRLPEATKTLTELLDSSPIDAEAWAELAELYFLQSMHSQAVFCLEEVLLIMPNAWNVRYTSRVLPSGSLC